MAITTFSINTNPTNGTLTGFNASTGSVTYTPNTGYVGTDSFIYNILCDGVVVDTAVVNIDVLCIPVSGGTLQGNVHAVLGVDETFVVTGISGLAPFTYNHVVTNGTIVGGQGTDTITVTPTGTPMSVTTTVGNCSGNNSVTLIKNIPVKVACNPTINVDFSCFTPKSITGTLQGITEPNRVTAWTQNSIQFTAKLGLHNYEFKVVDTQNKTHTLVLKNINC